MDNQKDIAKKLDEKLLKRTGVFSKEANLE